MAYDELMADRIRQIFAEKNTSFSEKKMMGGMAFMVNDKMCVGVLEERLMARLDPEDYEEAQQKPGCTKMMFTGREMKGWVFVYAEGTDEDEQLLSWIDLALKFNPKAKSSKKRKKA